MSDSGRSLTTDTSAPRTFGTQVTEVSGTDVPILFTSQYDLYTEDGKRPYQKNHQLPSAKYQNSVWHDLKEMKVKGSVLNAPRIRKGPYDKSETFYDMTDEHGEKIHHDKRSNGLKVYREGIEDWESLVECSLSSQELSDGYQRENFFRVLKRLQSAETITLCSNGITSLSHCTFPRCTLLNVSENYLTSFKSLPKTPKLVHLIARYNNFTSLAGLERFSSLKTLSLTGNGVFYGVYYRQRVFQKLPRLDVLDDIPKLKSDTEPAPSEKETCVIM